MKDRRYIEEQTERNNFLEIAAAGIVDVTLDVNKEFVLANIPSTSAQATNVYLPKCAEAAGRSYTVIVKGTSVGGSKIVVKSQTNDARVAYTSGNLDTADDRVRVESDGQLYHEVTSVIA